MLIVIIPIKVYALEGKVNLNCTPTSAYPTDVVTCTIAGDVVDGSITEFAASISLSDNLEYISAIPASSWTGTTTGGVFNLKTTTSQSDVFEISSFTVKVKEGSTTAGAVTLNITKLGTLTAIEPVSQTINMAGSSAKPEASTIVEDTGEDVNVDIKNPDTGSSIPFIILGLGVAFIISFYRLARNNKKIHKI